MELQRSIASVLGIGYMGKGGGTVTAAVVVLLWWLLGEPWSSALAVLSVLLLIVIGGWSAAKVERGWGPDSERVVVDELVGMALALFFLPHHWLAGLLAFVLFRFFDIVKPLGIRAMERLPGGYGVMADDVLAGLYANLAMQLIVRSNAWTWL